MRYKILLFITTTLVIGATACNDLDLYPLSEGSSSTWYSNETEINMALNDLYRSVFWPIDGDNWTDDWTYRDRLNEINSGTINGESSTVENWWKNTYKVINRANKVINNLKNTTDLPEATMKQMEADARFVRAAQYARLISHFGDVVFYTATISLEEAFEMGRTDKAVILQQIYDDYDYAIENLPDSYSSSETKHATKGTAMAMKARIALFYEDWQIAKDVAKSCMDLEIYSLYPNYQELFLSGTHNPSEVMFQMPRSTELDEYFGDTKNTITRNAGGWAAKDPSWELFCSYLCTDGLPIDESPLFDPQNPFNNRDPRCAMTIVEFQTPHLGFMYQPHPDSTEVLNFNTGQYQTNNDTRANAQYASYNGLVWRKWVDEDWSDDFRAQNDVYIMRYADVLLMYAEASIELNEIDQTVFDAINTVRARAYGVDVSATSDYPEVTTTDQTELRKTLRIERRMEFANEGLRYMDIIRWKLAEKVLNSNIYGMLDPADLKEKVVDPGLWFFPETPEIDEDGVPSFEPMYDNGLIKLLAIREFDATKQYLWPIPSKEVLINENISQNPNY